MNAKQFHERLEDLIRQAYSENPVPLSQMILDLELAKAGCVDSLLTVKTQKMIIQQPKNIVPASAIQTGN